MEDIENIPWTEEGLLALKHNVLRRIAKKNNCTVQRYAKKVDLVKALIENKSKSESNQLNGSVTALEKNDLQNSFSVNVVEERKSLLKSGMVGKDRRSTYLKEDSGRKVSNNSRKDSPFLHTATPTENTVDEQLKIIPDQQSHSTPRNVSPTYCSIPEGNCLESLSDLQNSFIKNIVMERNSVLKSGVVGKDRRSTYLKEDSDIEGILNTSKLISSETDTWLTCSSKKKNQRLRISSRKNSLFLPNTTPIKNNIDKQSITMSDQKLRNSSRNDSPFQDINTPIPNKSNIDGQSIITSDQELRRSSRKQSLVLPSPSFTKNNDRQLGFVTDIQERCVQGINNSFKTGVDDKDRRSTYLMESPDIQERCDQGINNSFKTGVDDKDRCSTYLKESPENDSTILQDLNNSIAEIEGVSLIRVTPDKTDLPSVKSNKRVTFQAGKESLQKLSTPRKIVKTPHKPKGATENVLLARKMPNFSAIHKERFKKMESLIDMKKRFEEKAKKILNSPVPKCAITNKDVTPGKKFCKMISKPVQIVTPSPRTSKISTVTPKVNTQSSTNITRFGFKRRTTKEHAREIVNKDVRLESEKKKEENKEIIKGVRLNRRFTLHMQARGLSE